MAEYGIRVLTQGGEVFGRLEHVAGDLRSGRPVGLVIARNGGEWLVPLDAVERHDSSRVILRGEAAEYEALPPFDSTAYRLLDREMEREETLRWMEEMGVEDFEIGSDEEDDALDAPRPVHTGAENPYRTPLKKNGNGGGPIVSDTTDLNEANEEMAERTRSDMH
jgi:hypothetical protein